MSAAIAGGIGLTARYLVNRFIVWNQRPREMTSQEVAALLRKMLDDTATLGEIDYFISVDLADLKLNAVKDEVGALYGPGWEDKETRSRLLDLLQRVEAMG